VDTVADQEVDDAEYFGLTVLRLPAAVGALACDQAVALV